MLSRAGTYTPSRKFEGDALRNVQPVQFVVVDVRCSLSVVVLGAFAIGTKLCIATKMTDVVVDGFLQRLFLSYVGGDASISQQRLRLIK